jgi:hypothetical protein
VPQGAEIQINAQTEPELMDSGSIEVYERAGASTTFRLRYPVVVNDDGDLTMLADDRFDPGSEVSILVPVEDGNECLVKGPIHGHAMHLDNAAADSWVEIIGSDTSVAMNRESIVRVWTDVTDGDAISNMLSSYGYIPDVQSTAAGHAEDRHALVQRETDLEFIKRLAKRNGYHFWVTCDSDGTETANFRQSNLETEPTATFVINQEGSNIDAIDLQWDVERPTSVESSDIDATSGSVIDGATTASGNLVLGSVGLIEIAPDTRSTRLTAPVDDSGDLQARSSAVLGESEWFIQGTTNTTLARLGSLVRAHSVVTVSGAGMRHSGNYYVTAVRHVIDSSQHRMDIELSRNGWNA